MKILGTAVIKNQQPRMVELIDKMAINGHVYDKTSLTPDKMSFLNVPQATYNMLLNTTGITNKPGGLSYDNIIQDKNDSDNIFIIGNTPQGASVSKVRKTKNGQYEVVHTLMFDSNYHFEFIDQDALFIYIIDNHTLTNHRITKIDKTTGEIVNTAQVGPSGHGKVNIICSNETDIYFAYSYSVGKFDICKYQRFNNTVTIFKQDYPTLVAHNNFYKGVSDSNTSMIIPRNEKSFNGENKIILKRYIIDSYEQKVYDKLLRVDCSMLPGGKMPVHQEDDIDGWKLERFIENKVEYLILYELQNNKKIYLLKKTRDDEYMVTQEISLGIQFNGLIAYNNCKTLILYDQYRIGFYTFSKYEERYELTHSENDLFDNIAIDRSQRIWVKTTNNEVAMLSENNPIKAEVDFEEDELLFTNTPLETKLHAYAKNFANGLIVADIEIMLSGPIVFTDTQSQIKKIKTSSAMPSVIPVTISGPGIVEAHANII